jgi:hypothetical protein
MRGWLEDNAARHGAPAGRLVETFTVFPTA